MQSKGISQLPVMDGGRPVGSVQEVTLARILHDGRDPTQVPISEVMARTGLTAMGGWLHVDAAWAGSALVCPEHRHLAAGLEADDVIHTIDGTDVTQMTTDEAVARIKGPEGSEVALGIERAGVAMSFSIERETPQLAASYMRGAKEFYSDPALMSAAVWTETEREGYLRLLGAIVVLGVLLVAFPVYVTFVASTHTLERILQVPMPLLPGDRYVLRESGRLVAPGVEDDDRELRMPALLDVALRTAEPADQEVAQALLVPGDVETARRMADHDAFAAHLAARLHHEAVEVVIRRHDSRRHRRQQRFLVEVELHELVDVAVHEGGQPRYPLLVSVE